MRPGIWPGAWQASQADPLSLVDELVEFFPVVRNFSGIDEKDHVVEGPELEMTEEDFFGIGVRE